MRCTLDASVLVAAARPQETHYPASQSFLQEATAQGVDCFCPAILLPESSSPIMRATGSARKAANVIREIYRFPRLRLIDVDVRLAHRAAEIGIARRLRGADSVYVAVAEAFQATLVTWDTEMLERAPAVVPTITPVDWLARDSTPA